MFWWHLPLPHSSYFQEIHIDPEKILKQLFGSTKGSKHTELLSRQLGKTVAWVFQFEHSLEAALFGP